MTEVQVSIGTIVQVMGQPGVWKIDRFVARGAVLVPIALAVEVFQQSCQPSAPAASEG